MTHWGLATNFSPGLAALINETRSARLATADSAGEPHLVPICFTYDGLHFYSVLDRKPKRTSLTNLKRVRNIDSNPNVGADVGPLRRGLGTLVVRAGHGYRPPSPAGEGATGRR